MSGREGQGPPEETPGRGPPEHLRRRRSRRRDDGTIEVGSDRLKELEETIDWENLTPLEEYLIRRVEELEQKQGQE